ncbi:MAG: L-dopachrome tautomerase-related protein [Verrucomicrobiota bacterium]
MTEHNLRRTTFLTAAMVLAWLSGGAIADVKLDVAANLTQGPGGLTVAQDGSMVVSLHPYFETRERVIRIDRNGEWNPFPSVELGAGGQRGRNALAFDSVIAVRTDARGITWLLDNGRRGESVPKLVGWNANSNEIHKLIYLPAPATLDSSYLVDFVLDPAAAFAYIADPAGGEDAALIAVDLESGLPRRVLQSHLSVTPEKIPLLVEGKRITARRVNGQGAEPMTGVNPIAIDRRGRFLYFGALKSQRLYRVEVSKLRDSALARTEVDQAVEYYAVKPICDSIAIDAKNNIYAADLTNNAITVITPAELKPKVYVKDPKLCWPDGLSFGPDGRLYFFCSQLHRTRWFNGGQNHTHAPFHVYRIKPMHQPFRNPIPNPIPKNPFGELGETFSDTFGR